MTLSPSVHLFFIIFIINYYSFAFERWPAQQVFPLELQQNLFTTATLRTAESGHCKQVVVGGGSTVMQKICSARRQQNGRRGRVEEKIVFSQHFHTTRKTGCISGISIVGFVDKHFLFSHPPLSHFFVTLLNFLDRLVGKCLLCMQVIVNAELCLL